jgi:hypothetical protein
VGCAAALRVPGGCSRDVAGAWVCGVLVAVFCTGSPLLPALARWLCSPLTVCAHV